MNVVMVSEALDCDWRERTMKEAKDKEGGDGLPITHLNQEVGGEWLSMVLEI